MSALLHQTLDELAGALLGQVIKGQPLSVCETRRLAAALQTASARARAIEGANVVPWPRAQTRIHPIAAARQGPEDAA